jgi:hypothetical protein
MHSIANKIVNLTNLKDKLLLGKGLSVVVIPLSYFFILGHLEFVLLPLLFVSLPQSLLMLFNL